MKSNIVSITAQSGTEPCNVDVGATYLILRKRNFMRIRKYARKVKKVNYSVIAKTDN